ncbi:Acetylcholine receptor subunit alpha-like 2 [Eumeta japonica]|uniref:Acetylcholine receptor subunit alpha-like 2 n=1 Tax=Eumeta variegata TaxID=151549 RepID=A0A4C1TJ59_EUMVA|nr:Acetylcholine receptor subunit alpha-like 2 [Eumeta japonica]
MAPWVRSFFIKRLPKLLLMRVPNDLLRDLAASKVNYGMSFNKTKFGKALMDEMNINSGNSSPDSIRRMQAELEMDLAVHRLQIGGGLSTLSGYNGLPSVLSGLDDSLSDVAPRKNVCDDDDDDDDDNEEHKLMH